MVRREMILSVVLHALLVAVVLIGGGSGQGNGQSEGRGQGSGDSETSEIQDPNAAGNSKDKNGNIVAKPLESRLVPEKELEELIRKDQERQMALEAKARQEKAEKLRKECPFFYGGIGISQIGNSVGHAFEGYPAYEAGILDGDIIISDVDKIRGEVGTIAQIDILRDGKLLHFSIKRDKICVEW